MSSNDPPFSLEVITCDKCFVDKCGLRDVLRRASDEGIVHYTEMCIMSCDPEHSDAIRTYLKKGWDMRNHVKYNFPEAKITLYPGTGEDPIDYRSIEMDDPHQVLKALIENGGASSQTL